MKTLAALAFLAVIAAGSTALAADDNKCWLVEEIKHGGFAVKIFLTDSHQDMLEGENLSVRYPAGQYDQPVEMTEPGWRRLFFQPPYVGHVEIWRGDKLVHLLNETGAFGNFSGLNSLFLKGADYPRQSCVTLAMYFNTGGYSAMAGRNLMLTVCPKEERLTTFDTNCYYDVLYERITGGSPDGEFERGLGRTPPGRQVCDSALNNYGPRGGLPCPVRLLIFDEKADQWRADKPGEFPAFYFRQVPVILSYAGLEVESAPPASRQEVSASGRALMAELLGRKNDFVKGGRLDLAFVTYSLLMMDLPEKDVRQFFLAMAAEYAKVYKSFDWGGAPEKAFEAIAVACRNFNPLERDSVFR